MSIPRLIILGLCAVQSHLNDGQKAVTAKAARRVNKQHLPEERIGCCFAVQRGAGLRFWEYNHES